MKVTDADVDDLARAIAKAIGRAGGGGGGGSGSGGGGGGSSGTDLASKIENSIVNPIEGSFKLAGDAGKAMAATIRQSQNEFTELSKVGAGFRGDLVNLSIAAANSRLNLSEFSNLIKENRENLIGLGGSVTRGAERFAQLSKAFQDSPVSDNLKLLGYTSKDLNEVLAIQMSSMRYTQKMDEAGKKQAIESATKLAEQMDEMSRLTGKSREEQAEAMKKGQQDAQIEAKMKLIGLKEGPEAEAKARALFTQQYNEAQLRGQGQMFKEVFATGQIMSKEAATQAALNSQQAAATRDSALATAKGNESAALAANERARKAAFDDSKDPAKLQMIALGAAGGEASKALGDNMMANRGVTDALRRLEIESGGVNTSFAELNAKLKENLALEKQGKDDNGKQVNELSKANILFEARMKDVAAGMNEYLLKPLYNLNPALKEFSGYMSKLGTDAGGTGKNIRGAIEDAGKGKLDADKLTGPENAFLAALNKAAPAINQAASSFGNVLAGAGQDLLKAAGTLSTSLIKAGEVFGDAAKVASEKIKQGADIFHGPSLEKDKEGRPVPPKRNTGSIGMSGKLFEDWGAGTLVELHGLEGVIKPDQMMNMAKGMASEGAAKAFGGLKGQLEKVKDFQQSGLDLSKISKDVTTTVSPATKIEIKKEEPKVTGPSKVEVINWPKDLSKVIEVPAKKEEAKKEEPKVTGPSKVEVINWPKDLSKVIEVPAKKEEAKKEEAKKEEAKPTEPKPATQANVRAVDNKIDIESSKKEAELRLSGIKESAEAEIKARQSLAEISKSLFPKSGAGEFGEELKLPFGSMMDEFGSNFEKVISDVNQSLGGIDIEQFGLNMEEINKDLVDSLPIIEVSKQQDIFKSQFTDSQKKLIDEYNGISDENRQFNIQRLEYHNNQDEQIRDKHDEIVSRLEQAKRERELTDEEEHQLSESQLIGKAAYERIQSRNEELNVLQNLDELTSKRQIEIAEQSNAAVIKANEAAMLEINDIQSDIEDVMSGMNFQPIELEDLITGGDTDYISSAIKDALPFDEMSGVDEATQQQESLSLFADDMRGGIDEISKDIQTNLGSMLDEYDQEDEEQDDTDYISSAIKDALPLDNLGEKFGDISQDINENLTSMIDDAAFSAGPGDASVAGIDFAENGPGDASVAGIDFAAPEPVKQALDSTNPFLNSKGEVDLNSINLPGMKKFGADLKSQTAAVAKKDENQSDAETARLQRQAEQKKDNSSTESKTDSSKATAATSKDATLNDVVKQLSSLNKSIKDLIDQNGKLLGDQIRATKSNNKNNFVGA
jgi:hypothetical protein